MQGLFENHGPDPLEPLLHASAVALNNRAVLIVGPSGSGKSTLAAGLINLGATLIADDRVIVAKVGDHLILKRPAILQDKLEIRGLGVLQIPSLNQATLSFVVNLSKNSENRFQTPQEVSILNVNRPIFYNTGNSNFKDAVLLMLRYGERNATIC